MQPLIHDGVVVATLASGSRGNCTYIGTPERGLIIDCGISAKQVLQRLTALGLGDAQLDAVLVTHEHKDHIGAAAVLERQLTKRQELPPRTYLTRGTRDGADARCLPELRTEVHPGQPFSVGALTVEPFTVPHDTLDPCAYIVTCLGVRVGVITDLGRSTRLVERQLASCDVAVLEFNHDVERLMDGSYPWATKQRIRGNHGHLSNAQAAEMLTSAQPSRLRHLLLGHLSDENNTPELARRAADEALFEAGLANIAVEIAQQAQPVGPICLPSAELPFTAPRTRRSEEASAQVSLFA